MSRLKGLEDRTTMEELGGAAQESRTISDISSIGDIVDRLSILNLKIRRHGDANQRQVCEAESQALWEGLARAGFDPDHELVGFARLAMLNATMWEAEATIRSCEHTGDFGSQFWAALNETHKLNRIRAAARRQINANADASASVIELRTGLDTCMERIAIGQVVGSRRPSDSAANWMAWQALWFEHDLPDVFSSIDFRYLVAAHHRLWEIKDELDLWIDGKAGRPPLCVGRSLYLVNDARCKTKQKLAKACRSAFWETKVYPSYRIPNGWSSESLSWATIERSQIST